MSTHGRIFVVGSANMDMVLRVPRFPRAGETLTGSDLELVPGGKGANQACSAARLGGDVHFVGCVGADLFGTQLIQSLQAAGVDVTRVRSTSRASGCASIYVEANGQNSIVISPGANADVSFEHVRHVLQDLNSSDFVLLQLEIPLETVHFTLELARAAGATSMLDPAPARRLDTVTLGLVDLLTPNQTEAGVLLSADELREEQGEPSDSELNRLGSELTMLGVRTLLLKLGGSGCAIYSRERATRMGAFPVHARHTTAAGDVFNGALAVALAEGLSVVAAAQFASAAAAISVTRSGAQTSIPDRKELDEFVKSNDAVQVRDLFDAPPMREVSS